MVVLRKVPTIVNWEQKPPFKLACPLCQHYDNLQHEDWQYFAPESPDILEIEGTHCCPSCWRIWRVFR